MLAGGVGKTTNSSTLACQLAYDRKVLLISTDPAHSLGDAFRMQFSGEPRVVDGCPNLEVMEVNLETNLHGEIEVSAALAKKTSDTDAIHYIIIVCHLIYDAIVPHTSDGSHDTIENIESGRYDTIVFDTAPTGHTLKLLQLPAILQAGLDKLQSWHAKIWDAWTIMKGLGDAEMGAEAAEISPADMKAMVSEKLEHYKGGMEKIDTNMKNKTATNFVVVCIAEFLSINETRRLLAQLQLNEVGCSHVIVNQVREVVLYGYIAS